MPDYDYDFSARLIATILPCDHFWNGPILRGYYRRVSGENITTLTCSKCGAWAVDVLKETA